MPSEGGYENVEQYRCQVGSQAEASGPQAHLGLEGAFQRPPLQEQKVEQSCSFAAGLLPPGKSVFVLACSERAWAGSLPRGLALARHSCRSDTMILTQILHTWFNHLGL